MRPDDRDLDAEIRGHLALEVQQRVARGEHPEAARLAALREFGYLPAAREEMRRVWYSRAFESVIDLARDVRVGLRSLRRARGLSAAVIVTLALGIGANAAIFSVVRGVLLRPLVNRGEDRLVYIRQSAPGIGTDNLTFSVPEIADLRQRATTIEAFGEFSTLDFTLVGLGDPRIVRAGLVNGTFFDVMGLQPALGRLLTPADDGPGAAGAAVLTHRFWTMVAGSDPRIIGRSVRLGSRTATIVGVLEPSIPYPLETELLANIVTSPHHLDATMVTGRTHRMTELFGRLARGATVDAAQVELTAAHAAVKQEYAEDYPPGSDVRLRVTPFRDQVTAQARPVLLVLLAATALVFAIACANVANLILARSVRREGELVVRAALGASRIALRRTLFAESLVLCSAGAALGVLIAPPLVQVVARFASRFSVRALDVTGDASLPWVGAGLALVAAAVLALVPRLPHTGSAGVTGPGLTTGGVRLTPRVTRRLHGLAVAQVALSFVLLSAAGTLVAALVALQARDRDAHYARILALDVPLPIEAFGPKSIDFHQEMMRRVSALPGVEAVAVSNVTPWRDLSSFGPFAFAVEGYVPVDGEAWPHAYLRNVSPGYFETLGVPLVAGRVFTDDDRGGAEPVAMVSESVARRLFANGDAVNRQVWWTDRTFGPGRRRIVGVVADFDDQHTTDGPILTIYHPFRQLPFAGRLLVRAPDPQALPPVITRLVRELAPDQPVEHAATLAEIRRDLLAPDRASAFVVAGFAGVALLIAAVGIAGVLAFSVSARTREFGVRLAVGSSPSALLIGVLGEGTRLVVTGLAVGGIGGAAIVYGAARLVDTPAIPGLVPLLMAASTLLGVAVVASLVPAARAARIDVQQALRME